MLEKGTNLRIKGSSGLCEFKAMGTRLKDLVKAQVKKRAGN